MEKKSREQMSELAQKQIMFARKSMLIALSLMGLLAFTAGLILGTIIDPTFYAISGAGVFFIILGIILYNYIPKKLDDYGSKSGRKKIAYGLFVEIPERIEQLEKQNAMLEERIKELEEKSKSDN